MANITFGGLATGLDTNALIDGLMAAERLPLDRIQTKKQNLSSARDTISALTSKLATLKTAALALKDPTQFASFTAASSDTGITTSVSGAASGGSYSVHVAQLAREQRSYSTTFAASTTALGATGTLTLQVGAGAAVDVTLAATDTLADVAAKINSAGARVGASVLYDGTTYRLQVRGLDTGAANAVSFTGAGATALGLDAPGATFQSAADAQLTVDGIAITRSTNQIAGVISGVTLALTKENVSSTIAVKSDPDGLKKKLDAFVAAYNDVVKAGQFAAGFGTIKAANQVLAGDGAIRSALDKISRIVGASIAGATGKYTTLMSVGLQSNNDGTLKLDGAKLYGALEADPTGVARLFVVDASIGATGAMGAMATAIDSLISGSSAVLVSRADAFSLQSKRLDDDADALQRRLDQYEETLRQRFTALEQLVSQFKAQGNALAGLGASSS